MSKDFDLNEQWHFYCHLVQLPEEKMGRIQATETKRAFMGACGQMLVLLEQLAEKDEPEAIRILDDLREQVAVFWKADVKRNLPEN